MQHGIILQRQADRTHIALIENGRPTEILIEPDVRPGSLGTVCMGRVVRVLPGMQAAFVDIGLSRSAFLYVGDLLPTAITGPKAAAAPPIDTLVRQGAALMLQVRKEAMGDKGARVTTHITLTGHFVVLMPRAAHVAISQRITDAHERARLTNALTPLSEQYGGIVARTAAADATAETLAGEVQHLAQRWQALLAAARNTKPRVLWAEATSALQAVRELYRPQMEAVTVNDAQLQAAIVQEIALMAPKRTHTVTLWQHAPPGMAQLLAGDVWRSHKVHKARAQALARRLPLKQGGYLLIEHTEALTVIDVNSGTFVGQKSLEKTMVALNVAAAEAIAEALRLRNIGGIVVIDFVDLGTAGGKQAVMEALEAAMAQDRAKHQILPMNRFGLVALTRRRLRPSLRQTATRPCPCCRGEGVVLVVQEIGEAVLAALYASLSRRPQAGLIVNAHPDVAQWLTGVQPGALTDFETAMNTEVFVVPQAHTHMAQFEIVSLDEPGAMEQVDLRL